ncbi:MAG: hypothetical protein AB7F86_02975 [Bdellovibrionales bacterium]
MKPQIAILTVFVVSIAWSAGSFAQDQDGAAAAQYSEARKEGSPETVANEADRAKVCAFIESMGYPGDSCGGAGTSSEIASTTSVDEIRFIPRSKGRANR